MEWAETEEQKEFSLVTSKSTKKKGKIRTELVNIASKGLKGMFHSKCAKVKWLPSMHTHGVCTGMEGRLNRHDSVQRKIFISLLNSKYMYDQIQTSMSRCCYGLPPSASNIHNSSPRLSKSSCEAITRGSQRIPGQTLLGPLPIKDPQINLFTI